MNQDYFPLGKYIQLSKEKNTNLLAKRHFGLSASEGLVELPWEEGKTDKSAYWVLRKERMAVDLLDFGSVKELAIDRYSLDEIGAISNIHSIFDIVSFEINNEYLSLIFKSLRTRNILLHFACQGIKMALPWEDFCGLPIRVPPPSQQEELVKKYKAVEKIIKLKRVINKILEKWMECYYHILFDNVPEDQLEIKGLGELMSIFGGGTPSTKVPEYWTKEGGIPWIGIRDLTSNKGKFIDKGEINITEEGEKNSSTKLIPDESILFACVGSSMGSMGINDFPMCFSQNFFGCCKKEETLNYCWFLLKKNVKNIRNLSKGYAMDVITKQDFERFSILVPPEELIYRFERVCNPFFKIQKKNEQEIRELKKLQRYFIELTN